MLGIENRINGWAESKLMKKSFSEVLRGTTDSLGIAIYPEADDKTVKILRTAPTIVIIPHYTVAAAIESLAALPPRPDQFILANSLLLGFIKPLDRHLVPLFVQNEMDEPFVKIFSLLRSFARLPKYDTTYFQPPDIRTPGQANLVSLAKATALLENGHLIAIAPTGPTGKKEKWSRGIGKIIRTINHANKGENTFVVFANTRGSKDSDFTSKIFRKNPLARQVAFQNVGPTGQFSAITNDEATKLLESLYETWCKSLGLPSSLLPATKTLPTATDQSTITTPTPAIP